MAAVSINEIEPHVAMRQYRERLGLRKCDVSRKTGLSGSHIYEIETGCTANPTRSTRERLGQVYPPELVSRLTRGASTTQRLRHLENDERFQRLRAVARTMKAAIHEDRFHGDTLPIATAREWVDNVWRLLDRRGA